MKEAVFVLTERQCSDSEALRQEIIQQTVNTWLTKELYK